MPKNTKPLTPASPVNRGVIKSPEANDIAGNNPLDASTKGQPSGSPVNRSRNNDGDESFYNRQNSSRPNMQ